MMSPQAIADLSAEQSRQAAERMRAPAAVFSAETAFEDARRAPWLGEYVHPAWEKADYGDFSEVLEGVDYAVFADDGWPWLFVDKSGFGEDNEPALSQRELAELFPCLAQHAAEKHLTLGVGIVEEGQFQCHLALYTK